MSKETWQEARKRAMQIVSDIRAADERYVIDVRIPNHANVMAVEGGHFVEAIVWVPDATVEP